MSIAAKCDRCGSVFAWKRGCVTIELLHVVSKPRPDGNRNDTWSEIDFCPKCSVLVLDVVGKALNGLRRPR